MTPIFNLDQLTSQPCFDKTFIDSLDTAHNIGVQDKVGNICKHMKGQFHKISILARPSINVLESPDKTQFCSSFCVHQGHNLSTPHTIFTHSSYTILFFTHCVLQECFCKSFWSYVELIPLNARGFTLNFFAPLSAALRIGKIPTGLSNFPSQCLAYLFLFLLPRKATRRHNKLQIGPESGTACP